MQIQRINNQQSIVNRNQAKKNNTPSFGVYIYAEQKLVQSVGQQMKAFPKIESEVNELVRNFVKSVAEHNANPEAHRMFGNNLNIKDIQVYFKNGKGLDFIAKAAEDLKPSVAQIEDISTRLINNSQKLQIHVLTETGTRVNTSEMRTTDTKRWVDAIQAAEIKKIEKKNPDVYLDMIQPPKK